DQFRAADRRVEMLDVRLVSSDDGMQLLVPEFVGSIYGGALVGRGVIEWADPPRYRMMVALEDVELGPLLEPRTRSNTEGGSVPRADETAFDDAPQRQTTTGLASAGLSLEAVL